MTTSSVKLRELTEAAAGAVAREIASLRREVSRERETFAAEMRAARAEWEARLAAVVETERRLNERIATIKDGRDGTNGADGASVSVDDVMPAILARTDAAVAENVERVLAGWERPKDGASVTVADVEPVLREMVAALPPATNGKDGADADPEVIRSMVADAVAAIPVPKDGRDGADGVSVTADDVLPVLEARVAELVAAIPAPKDGRDGSDGKDVDIEAVRAMVAEQVAALPPAKDGEPGKSVTVDDVTPIIEARMAELVSAIELPALPDIGEMVREAVAEIPAPKDGIDGKNADPEATAALVREEVAKAVSAIPPAKDGASVTVDDVAPLIVEEVERRMGEHAGALSRQLDEAVAAIPVPKDGEPGAPGERGPEGPIGKLPAVKEWADGVFYEGAVVTRDGGVYQALRDTGKEPGHADWLCIVAKGRDGADGRSPNVRELWSADEEYRHLDIVALNGASFIAKRDNPGECPGDGWQLMAMQGKQGKPGQAIKGDPGRAATVTAARISDDGLLTLTNADGSEVQCDLYPVLSRLG